MIFRKSALLTFIITYLTMCTTWQMGAQGILNLKVTDAMGETGNRVCLDVTAENFNQIESIQFNLSYDATLVVPECPATYVHPLMANNIFGDIFNCINKDNGFLNFVWASDPTTIPDNEIIFTLCFNIIGKPGNKSPVYFNGLILDIEICSQDSNGASVCTEELNSNVGTIMIISNTLQVFYNKCDADGVNNLNNASLTFYGTGGLPPYTYNINSGAYMGTLPLDGQRTTIPNIPEGMYTIVITDSNNLMATAGPFTISNSIPITYDTPKVSDPTCADRKNGSIEIPNIAGLSPFTYKWSNLVSGTDTYSKLTGLSKGIYTVTITDFGGCEVQRTFELKLDTLKLTLDITRNASCNQPSVKDGRVSISGIGGTPYKGSMPYEFSLNGNNWIKFTPPHTINNLPAGDFTIIIRDSLFCDTDAEVFNMPFNKTIDMKALTTDISCFGAIDGEVKLTASPYSVDYTFLPLIGYPNLGMPKIDTFKISDLPKGNYAYRLLDNSGCKDTVFFSINEPAIIAINPSLVQPDCTGPGSITLAPSGGTGSFKYKWLPASGDVNTLTGLVGGSYAVTVTDNNDCTATDIFQLNNSGTLNISLTKENVTCSGKNDGKATVTVLFSGGQNQMFEIFWRDGNNNDLPIKVNTMQNLAPGNYSVQVIAADGCKSLVIPFIISDQIPVYFATTITNAPCNGAAGKIVVNIKGNPTGFTYEWKPKSGTNIIDNDNTLDEKAGEYIVTAISPNNCRKDTTITITEPGKITFPAPVTRNVTCFGLSTGQAAIMNPPLGLNFTWSTGSVGPFAINFATGEGWVIASSGACKSDTVKFSIGTFPVLAIDEAKTIISNPVCFGDKNGSVTIEAKGGTGLDYKYAWAGGKTGANLNNISSGAYIVTISDSNNCSQQDTFFLSQPDKLDAFVDNNKTVELDCNNQDGGKIGLFTTGGNPGVKTIQWQTGVLTDNNTAIGLSPGTYCATVSDNFGCKDTVCYTLTAPAVLKGEVNTPVEPLCNGGESCISVKYLVGGTGNKYTFQINNGTRYPIDSCVTVFAGQYFINLIDSAGCSIDTIITIGQPAPITVDAGLDREIQLGLPSPVINVNVDSSVGIDTLVWSPAGDIICLTQNCISVEAAPAVTTTYLITVTDLNGCKGSDEITVDVKNVRNVYFANIFTPNRDGENEYFQAVTGPGVEKILSFTIFDRWGNKVFDKSDYMPDPAGTDGWDGTLNGRRLDPAVFVYYSRVRFIDGKEINYSGSVTLADKIRN